MGDEVDVPLPPKGVIQTKGTAIAIGEILLREQFGNEAVDQQKPFEARLEGGIWVISGYVPPPSAADHKLGSGKLEIHVRKYDGRVVKILRWK